MITRLKVKKSLFFPFILLVLFLLTSPFWVWRILPEKNVQLAIIDKTVDRENYREHSGLVWGLNHLKIQKQNGGKYDEKEDFYYEFPDFQKDNFPEMIYLADSYGIETVHDNNRVEVDGGLTTEEVDRLRSTVNRGNTILIAEFNTFASPTQKKARDEISELLHLKWSGWIGRYFSDINDKEVPVWVQGNYKEQYGDWKLTGAGLLFVHESGEMVVLEEKDMKKQGATFRFTKKGEEMYHLNASIPYPYWFDVITPVNEKEVMAEYELNLTDSGKEKMMKHNIPLSFPAILHHQNSNYDSVYFAGDYADQSELPGIYQTWGLSWFRQHLVLDDGKGSMFYWKVYLPLMKTILDRAS